MNQNQTMIILQKLPNLTLHLNFRITQMNNKNFEQFLAYNTPK